ncbi:DUF2808 domain-containing protein [Chroococcus sp. FPU101]|uniref:DUF2808 domain-containing protein n=1 Tax=Chroococcus sp. FPU101 TaxID=1974212 RepID=UPI001A8E1D4E|nr:DUF2808 domain-containing protein [Chroococcus sp. FPU101]GFE67711.1 hypothetical protein CFPU101_03210 [Chroococcus sp. FPU101]
MNLKKVLSKGLIATLVLAGSLMAGFQAITWANGNSGLTIFSGVDRKDILDYYLQFGGRPNQWERYKLYIPAKKMTQGASTFFISYPDYFNGRFDTDKVEVRVGRESLPLKEVIWDQESRVLEISLAKPIEASTRVELVLSNVRNPDFGTYYLVGDVLAAGDIPVRLYLGTWIVSIDPGS